MASITSINGAKPQGGSTIFEKDGWYLLLLVSMTMPLTVVMTTPIAPIPGFRLSNILVAVPFLILLRDPSFWRTKDRLERNAIIVFSIYILLFAIDFWRSLPNLGAFHLIYPKYFEKDASTYFLYELISPAMGASTFIYALKRMRTKADMDRMFSAIGAGTFVLSCVFIFACITHTAELATPDRSGMVKLCDEFFGVHYNAIGTVFIISAPIILYAALTRGPFWTFNFSLALVAIFLLESRTALFLFMLISAMTMIAMGRTALLIKIAPVVAVGAVYLVGKFLYAALSAGWTTHGVNVHELLAGREDLIWAPLLFEWVTVKHKFFWGAGLHGMLTSRLLRMGLIPPVAEAHDMYIEFLLDYGIYMTLMLLLALAAGFRWAYRLGRRIQSERYWVLFLCSVGFFISALTGRHFFPNFENMLMFPTLGAMINAARLQLYPAKTDARPAIARLVAKPAVSAERLQT